ncbi:hypothetical protein SLV14_003637 [Streptomyces sp. Je 1-4]|uniref:hypothetical protein n=1 Tax=Streptomyces TaxID=1883 RepID=UPI0021DB2E3D|nr:MULTISPECIES: hypothetical protein [unclassified Streptomyces]UYB40957.1 hypothetical protein SLV14_003637 [Streptomyces sp. Je 1-4]UZQ37118.1 hypothetical protein SLV14N_003637 [Streptomyces sp. Je 1-4] [Streptomyces sp. Je 1-4 4N24]UZQ44535.1 hypothetical protein SLV14NA_003637 [Streptomyces sp. Je 1-4] [Streptomyces sp. Je 1-4 4N24_ara]
MFDLRTEAEMRLYSEKLAKELALKKLREKGSDSNTDTPKPPPADEGHSQGTEAPDTELKPM